MDVCFVNTASLSVPQWTLRSGGRGKMVLPVRCGVVQHPREGLVLLDMGSAHRSDDVKPSWPLGIYERVLGFDHHGVGMAEHLTTHGLSTQDVRHVILTHLHADHLGDWRLFPHATFWVHKQAVEQALSFLSWTKGVFSELLPPLDRIKTFDISETKTPLDALSQDEVFSPLEGIRLVSLPGHVAGHCGVWVDGKNGSVFYASDVSWTFEGILEGKDRFLTRLLVGSGLSSQERSRLRVRDLVLKKGCDVVLCHDPHRLGLDAVDVCEGQGAWASVEESLCDDGSSGACCFELSLPAGGV